MIDRDIRSNIVLIVFFVAAISLIGRAAQIQILGKSVLVATNKSYISKKTLYPSRGLIRDRDDKVLVYNIPIYDLHVTYNHVSPDIDTVLFCDLLEIDEKTFVGNLDKNWSSHRYHKSIPFTFLSKISPDIYARFQEHLHKFPGFQPVLRSIRSYPHNSGAHFLGYLGEVNQKDLDRNPETYSVGDYIGVSGLEKTYEDHLRGSKGIKYVLKDNLGRSVGSLDDGRLDSMSTSGFNLKTGISLDLQAYGEELMKNKRGSIVAIEPATGEILSLVSSPSYDPNLLCLDQRRDSSFRKLMQDTINEPFLNRSVIAQYPPGSIFKPIFALIALQSGITHKDRTIYCDGEYAVNAKRGYTQGCRNHPTPYNLPTALQYSCNSYFYQLMKEYIEQFGYYKPEEGLSLLNKHLKEFGLGDKLGVDSYFETSGYIPTPEFYDDLYNYVRSGWKSTYILSLGIGQGELQFSTIQIANLAAILANRGYYITPHLVKDYIDSNEDVLLQYREKKFVSIDREHFDPIIEGMERVVHSGTAQMAYVRGLPIAGKTGTSQNSQGEDHSVFFGFAPVDNPKIAIAVYVENAGGGGTVAAPIGGLMIEKFINGNISPNTQWKEDRIKAVNLLKTER